MRTTLTAPLHHAHSCQQLYSPPHNTPAKPVHSFTRASLPCRLPLVPRLLPPLSRLRFTVRRLLSACLLSSPLVPLCLTCGMSDAQLSKLKEDRDALAREVNLLQAAIKVDDASDRIVAQLRKAEVQHNNTTAQQ